MLALAQGDWAEARAAAEAARSDWQALALRGEQAMALRQLGILELMRGQPDGARVLFEEGLVAARTVGDRIGEGLNLWRMAQAQIRLEKVVDGE